jgi:hypothetical protein
MPESHFAAKPTLSFAKLVAIPTEVAWSQAYNAGNLFVCLSLIREEPTEDVSLHALGKDIFNILQSEFFSLEEKTPEAIKEALRVSTAKLPENIQVNITLANFKENALTVFVAGSGKVVMKRKDKIGVLLEKHDIYSGESTFASGFLENADTIVLQTGQFAEGIPHESVLSALDLELPNDVVEAMSPQVHEQDNGAQAAIVVRFSGPSQHAPQASKEETDEQIEEPIKEDEPQDSEETEETETSTDREDQTLESAIVEGPAEQPEPELEIHVEREDRFEEEEAQKKSPFALPKFSKSGLQMTHKRKLYLSVAVILFVLLAASIFFTVKKQNDEQRQAIFAEIYASAQKEYETGQGIESLNPEGSRENYLRAESKLKEGQAKIGQGTEEYKKIEELLTKVTAELQGTQEAETNTLKEATAPANSLIAVAKDNASAKGFGQNETTVYMVNADTITSVTKSSGSKKEIVENDDTWSSPQAVVPYQANVYVLDQKEGVIKFVPSGSDYTDSSYFTGAAPNLSKATGMAIDSSIWIVTTDGKILKYTRGSQDTFGISGIDKPLSNPTKIVTDSTMDSIYVMDNGNKRIVKFDKKGAYQKSYPAGIIGQAKEFEVDIKNNRFLVLSGSKIWELPL